MCFTSRQLSSPNRANARGVPSSGFTPIVAAESIGHCTSNGEAKSDNIGVLDVILYSEVSASLVACSSKMVGECREWLCITASELLSGVTTTATGSGCGWRRGVALLLSLVLVMFGCITCTTIVVW